MLRLQARAEPSQTMRYLSPLIAVALTVIGGLIIFSALGRDPLAGFKVFFLNPLKDWYSIAELLLKATPLMMIAIGLAVGFRANVWNIGAEGQYIIGAVFGSGVALYFKGVNSPLVLPTMIVAGALIDGLLGQRSAIASKQPPWHSESALPCHGIGAGE